MASYCQQCNSELFARERSDFVGLCPEGQVAIVLCDGCGGFVEVDAQGRRVNRKVYPYVSTALLSGAAYRMAVSG